MTMQAIAASIDVSDVTGTPGRAPPARSLMIIKISWHSRSVLYEPGIFTSSQAPGTLNVIVRLASWNDWLRKQLPSGSKQSTELTSPAR
jgi:hypothetical protein